jgi:WbqC-like protein family
LESLKSAYGNAPYLSDHLGFLEELFSNGFEKLVDLNLAIIRYLLDYLEIPTKLILLSDLGIAARGTGLLIEICQELSATSFLTQSQAKKYLDSNLFQHMDIDLNFFKYVPPVYPQLWGDFLANLSAFDLVLNCGPKTRDILLRCQRV